MSKKANSLVVISLAQISTSYAGSPDLPPVELMIATVASRGPECAIVIDRGDTIEHALCPCMVRAWTASQKPGLLAIENNRRVTFGFSDKTFKAEHVRGDIWCLVEPIPVGNKVDCRTIRGEPVKKPHRLLSTERSRDAQGSNSRRGED